MNKYTDKVRESLSLALKAGAQKARITLDYSREDYVATLDGEVDKVTHCEDSVLTIALFADGRFGSFSTNNLEDSALEAFMKRAVDTVRMLAPDLCRDLPSNTCGSALSGEELGLYDPTVDSMSPEDRINIALSLCATGTASTSGEGWRLVSEEGEYSDSEYVSVVGDTAGTLCVHHESSFDYGVEVTIEDDSGEKHDAYWWEASTSKEGLHAEKCGEKAISLAASRIGSSEARGGKYNMVVASEVASKMVSPLLKALDGYSLQQNNSFLDGSLGKRIFSEGLTLMDDPLRKGESGSKLFDSEGVAYSSGEIIGKGTVRKYFINTYMSRKMGLDPTVEDAGRPHLMPWPEPGLGREDILGICGSGILVTGFNGGNCNGATGDFSYGIEGFLFKEGKILRPVSGMVVTGNYVELWNNLIAAGEDFRPCMSKLIPTLAFSNVNFNG